MKIFIATDHRGVDTVKKIISYLKNLEIDITESKIEHNDLDDYPDFAFDVCKNVLNNPGSLGILVCGTGIGMSIAANKVKGIRAARCTSVDDAYYSKCHNCANVLCIGMNTPLETIFEMIDTFINTKYPDEEKHLRRVDKIIKYESGTYNEL